MKTPKFSASFIDLKSTDIRISVSNLTQIYSLEMNRYNIENFGVQHLEFYPTIISQFDRIFKITVQTNRIHTVFVLADSLHNAENRLRSLIKIEFTILESTQVFISQRYKIMNDNKKCVPLANKFQLYEFMMVHGYCYITDNTFYIC